MATVTTKIEPYKGLCEYCKNFVKTQSMEDISEQEGIVLAKCEKTGLSFLNDVNENLLSDTVIDDVSYSLTRVLTSISNCNQYEKAATVQIDSVLYDAAIPQLEIDYTVQAVETSPATDAEFYYVGTAAKIGVASAVTDGSGSINIAGALSDGNYYLYSRLSTGEISIIYGFSITTS